MNLRVSAAAFTMNTRAHIAGRKFRYSRHHPAVRRLPSDLYGSAVIIYGRPDVERREDRGAEDEQRRLGEIPPGAQSGVCKSEHAVAVCVDQRVLPASEAEHDMRRVSPLNVQVLRSLGNAQA